LAWRDCWQKLNGLAQEKYLLFLYVMEFSGFELFFGESSSPIINSTTSVASLLLVPITPLDPLFAQPTQ
jgi:hypothetical protein